jgi:hypothetical protein
MPDTPDTQGSIFDQLSESFEKKVDQLIDISVLPEHIAEFLQTAKPDEISLLNVALSEHSFGRMSLAECMKASIEGQEREARADADSGEAASGSQEPNSSSRKRQRSSIPSRLGLNPISRRTLTASN